jgi:hypothetical protein
LFWVINRVEKTGKGRASHKKEPAIGDGSQFARTSAKVLRNRASIMCLARNRLHVPCCGANLRTPHQRPAVRIYATPGAVAVSFFFSERIVSPVGRWAYYPAALARLSVEVSFPQQHLNMRRVRPSFGPAMLTMSSAFARQCRQRTTSASNDFEP